MSPRKPNVDAALDALSIVENFARSLDVSSDEAFDNYVEAMRQTRDLLDRQGFPFELKKKVDSATDAFSLVFRTAIKVIKIKDDALRALMPQRFAFWFVVALYLAVLIVFLFTLRWVVVLGVVPVAILQSLLLKDDSIFKTLARVLTSYFRRNR